MRAFRYARSFAALLTAALLTGCGAMPTLAPEPPEALAVTLPPVADASADLPLRDVHGPSRSPLTGDMVVLRHLTDTHEDWDGTPYRFGGASRDGIDCSAFVQQVFSETFGVALTRSTHSQVMEGREVPREALQPGDLVFFRTGRRQQHVGIYLRDGRFLHASTSRGVTTDALDSGYYDRTYWTARRVLRPELVASLVYQAAPSVASTAGSAHAAATDGSPSASAERPEPAASDGRSRPRTRPPGFPADRYADPEGADRGAPSGRRSGW